MASAAFDRTASFMAYLSAVVVALVTVLAVGAMAIALAAIRGMFQLLQ